MDYDSTFAVAEDGGNGYQKSSINDEFFVYPSLLTMDDDGSAALISSTNGQEVSKFFANNNFLNQMDVSIQSDGLVQWKDTQRRFQTGRNTLNTSVKVHEYDVTDDTKKIANDTSFVSILSLIAYKGIQDYWQKNYRLPQEINVKVDRFATALPLNEYRREGSMESFKSRFADHTHVVTIHNFNMPIKVNIIFELVTVIPEGYAANLALIYDPKDLQYMREDDIFRDIYYPEAMREDPSFRPITSGKQIKNMAVLGVDIGDGSTDLAFNKGYRNQLSSSTGLEMGIGTAAQEAIDELNTDNPNNVHMKRQDFVKFAMNSNSRLAEIYQKSFISRLNTYFQELDDLVDKAVRKYNGQLDLVVVSGGGATVLEKFHLAEFRSRVETASGLAGIPILVVSEKYSQFLNLNGLRYILFQQKLVTQNQQ